MKTVIKLDNVCKQFGRTKALDHASLEVPEGVVFALLGKNGAGKTTMIRILTGFEKPDSGSATVLGQSCVNSPLEIRKQTGYVSDSPALYDWMRPEEIGWFTSAFYEDDFPIRYLELLADFDVPTGTAIKHLSKGQRAKVALALATAHQPSLLILDEPTSGLDPMVRRKFLESMVDFAAAGRTVLLSSHQISEVERVADWVAIVHSGKVKVVQPLDALKSSTAIVTATLDHAEVAAPLPPGQVLTESQNGRQMRWVVMGLPGTSPDGSKVDGSKGDESGGDQSSQGDWKKEMEASGAIKQISCTPATLEEIFVAVCDDRAKRPGEETLVSEVHA